MRQNRQAERREVERLRGDYEERVERAAAGMSDDAIEIVRSRLQEAARLIERTTGSAHPRGHGSAWPPMMREFADLVAQEEAEQGERDREQPRIHIQPTARQITLAEDALTWRRYVTEAQALAALNIWLRCRALRIRSWQKEAVRRGFSRETAKRRLARAYLLIAVGLTREGKSIEEAHR